MQIEVSVGEVLDKLSILKLKLNNLKGRCSLEYVKKEYDYISDIVENLDFFSFQPPLSTTRGN